MILSVSSFENKSIMYALKTLRLTILIQLHCYKTIDPSTCVLGRKQLVINLIEAFSIFFQSICAHVQIFRIAS